MADDRKTERELRINGHDGRLAYVVLAESSANWCDFRAWQVSAWEESGQVLFGECSNWTPEYRDHEPLLTGFVKWDGCSEWALDSHHCGPEGVLARHKIELDCLRTAHAAMVEAGGEPQWDAP